MSEHKDDIPHAPLSLLGDGGFDTKLWSDFMNRVGLDVFQFILSFLPPIPYLFQLKRVSSHWKELCEECMKEDCSELYWDQQSSMVILNILRFDLQKYRDQLQLPKEYMDLHITNVANFEMIGFLRNVLMSFKKLRSLTFRNMDLNPSILYLIFVEWAQDVESIKFVECTVNLTILPKKILFDNNGTIETLKEFPTTNTQFICEMKFEQNRHSTLTMNNILKGMKESKVKSLDFYGCRSYGDDYYRLDVLGLILITFIGSFNSLESAYYEVSQRYHSIGDQLPLFKKLLPNVKFNIPCHEVASKMLVYSKYEEVIDYYMSYLVKNFYLRRNRLEAYRSRKLQSREQFNIFHEDIIPELVKFFKIYSPFGFDTELKDIQGFNILQIAITSGLTHVTDFIMNYLVYYNEDMNAMEVATHSLNNIFASNNRLDGRNTTFIVVTKGHIDLLNTMLKCKVHFNARDKEGSTVAHYFAQFGQISKLKLIVELLDKLPTVEERKYFLDLNIVNNNGETAVDICYKYKMFGLLKYLAEIAARYDIQNIPETLPAQLVLTPEDISNAVKQKDPPKIEEKKTCFLQ